MYFSPGLVYCKINNVPYNLVHPVLNKKNTFYVPIQSFYQVLYAAGLPFRIIKETQSLLYVIKNFYNVNKLDIANKKNGTLIELFTSKKFDKNHVSSSVSSSNWLNITILGGILDSININNSLIMHPISDIKTMQSNESAQVSLLLMLLLQIQK